MKEDCYNLPLHYTRTQWNHKDVDDDDDDDDDDGGGGGGDVIENVEDHDDKGSQNLVSV